MTARCALWRTLIVASLVAASLVTASDTRAAGGPHLQVQASNETWAVAAEWSGAVPAATSWTLVPALLVPSGAALFILGGEATTGGGIVSLQCTTGGLARSYTGMTYSVQAARTFGPGGGACSVSVENTGNRAPLTTSFKLLATAQHN